MARGRFLKMIIVVLMVAFVLFLHSNNEEMEEAISQRIKRSLQQKIVKRILKDLWLVLDNTSIIDPNGGYHIYPNAFKGSDLNSKNTDDVVLVTHCTVNHLDNLITLSRAWDGPISATVFIPSPITELIVQALLKVFLCVSTHNKKVTINIVQPVPNEVKPFLIEHFFDIIPSKSCDDIIHDTKMASIQANYKNIAQPYPNNLLRNVGVTFATVDFVFIIDVDMLPSAHLHSHFLSLVQKRNDEFFMGSHDMNAFIVPAFEVTSLTTPILWTKTDLLEQLAKGIARPFYSEVCDKCQHSTLYDTWRNIPLSEQMDIAYQVPWLDPWEPFYIAKRQKLPLYEENFKQFGFNRISQLCEMHVAGYNFSVLNNAFLVHQGFKTPGTFHKTKEEEQERNRLIYREHKEDLKRKYKNERRC